MDDNDIFESLGGSLLNDLLADLNAAVVERLRARHAITVRALPLEVMPAHLRRLDLHSRQLQLS